MNPNDIINQAFVQLQTSNALMASKLRIEQLEKENSLLKTRGGVLCQIVTDLSHYAPANAVTEAVVKEALKKWYETNV